MARTPARCLSAMLTALMALIWPCSATAQPASASVDVEVTFLGAIAFAPDGADVSDGLPMGSGNVERMWVLFPRAFDPVEIERRRFPDMREFRPRHGQHRGHDLIVQVCAKYLVENGEGMLTFPISKPSSGSYEIKMGNLSLADDRKESSITYSGFDSVPPVMGRTQGSLELLPVPDDIFDPPDDYLPRLSAGMILEKGWSLNASPTHRGTMGTMPCDLLGCHDVKGEGYPRGFPRAVTATFKSGAVAAGEKVTLNIGYPNGTTTLALPLIPVPEGKDRRPTIKIAILHGPLNDVLYPQPPDPTGEEHHFKLFYLIPNDVVDPYYFPTLSRGGGQAEGEEHQIGAASCQKDRKDAASCPPIHTRGDPFCTPLAQFVRRRGTKRRVDAALIERAGASREERQ